MFYKSVLFNLSEKTCRIKDVAVEIEFLRKEKEGVFLWTAIKTPIKRNAPVLMSPVPERVCAANVSVTTGKAARRPAVCFRLT
jgi:hypothetical protein